MEILKENKAICFEVDLKTEIIKSEKPCNWGMHYLSVIGSGIAEFIEEPEEKKKALDTIMQKYDDEGLSSYDYSESSLKRTAVIKLIITELTGKRS